MKIDLKKIVCSSCLIIYKEHNQHKIDDRYIIKLKKKIDLDGYAIEQNVQVICVVCKNINNINKCYIFF